MFAVATRNIRRQRRLHRWTPTCYHRQSTPPNAPATNVWVKTSENKKLQQGCQIIIIVLPCSLIITFPIHSTTLPVLNIFSISMFKSPVVFRIQKTEGLTVHTPLKVPNRTHQTSKCQSTELHLLGRFLFFIRQDYALKGKVQVSPLFLEKQTNIMNSKKSKKLLFFLSGSGEGYSMFSKRFHIIYIYSI